MNYFLTIRNFISKNALLFITAGWLLTLSYLFQFYWSYTSAPSQVKKAIQKSIQKKEARFQKILNDTVLLKQLKEGTFSKETYQKLLKEDYFIFGAVNNNNGVETFFWNTQTILPEKELWQRTDGVWFEQLINGYYTVDKKTCKLSDGSTCMMMALIPVKWNYFVATKDLNNDFPYLKGIENKYTVSDLIKSSNEIRSKDNTFLFWLRELQNFPQPLNAITIVLRLLAIICLVLVINRTAVTITVDRSFKMGVLFLIVVLSSVRILSYYIPIFFNSRQFELFNPSVYGSNNILKSLGDLLINALLLVWILLFIRKYASKSSFRFWHMNKYPGMLLIAGIIFLLTILFGNIIRSLVADSEISFNVTNFFSLSVFSFIGFFILGCLAFSYYIISKWLYNNLKHFSDGKITSQLLSVTVIGLLYLTVTFNAGNVTFHLSLLIWLLLFSLLLNSQKGGFRFLPAGGKNIFWFFFFSVSLTVLLIHVNSKKEWEGRVRMAENLGLQTDPGAENLLSIALQNFRTDFLRENFLRLKTSGTNQFLKDSILNEHFSGYLNKFETEIFTFDEAEHPLYNADSATFNSLNTIYNLQSKQTSVRDWRYYEESFDKFYYLAKKEVTDTATKKPLGFLFILSRPKRFTDQKFYPELFSKTYNLQAANSPFYAYAIYKNKKLINHFNDYQFPIQLGTDASDQPGFFEKNRNGYSELWYNISNEATVIIVKDENRVLETITLFAYLFFVFLIMGAGYSVIQFLSKVHWRFAALKEQLEFTFRTQVHATIIGISVLSFLIIGVSTIIFFINRHNRNNKERLSSTIQIMNDEVEQALKDHLVFDDVLKLYDDIISAELQAKVNRISEIHGVDVNIYDPNGSLRISSQPYYYIKGVLSRKINPAAYYTLSKEQFIQTIEEEQVGSRSYMSIYAPVRDAEGIAYAYINIPYFTSQNELKQEISNFLVTLITLNAFIFLIAGLIAFFVTSRITNSFLIISQKLKEIKLGKTNEAIVWHRNDEIGELVQEYNKMVLKLEDSAKLLARSEREGAWREMARQVAHEIKNPLTPMKLSIQYLQKAIDSNSPDAKPISQSVAKTLVEQIDYLSNIASDFSNFANIGNPVMEKVNLCDSLQSVVDLFSMEENGSISYEKSKEEIFVMADKTQLNRLFTNLIRNAFESASGTYKAEVHIQCTLKNSKVLIQITDNGEGIKPEMKDKIFYPNFTTKTSGTGLGLAMCKSIIEQMKGEIWFETEVGKGSSFFIELNKLN